VNDFIGPPLPTAEEKALLIETLGRLGMPLPKPPAFRDEGGPESVPLPFNPNPMPMTDGAATGLNDH
jgi:hypothetical protein